jgi:hypothetical protein
MALGRKFTQPGDLPPEKAKALAETSRIVQGYLMGLWIISAMSARDPEYASRHLLRYLAQDLLEAAVSAEMLAYEGVHRVIMRELRFLLEASSKLAAVQQSSFSSTTEVKLKEFDQELKSHRISVEKTVDLHFYDDAMKRDFIEEVGRLYGVSSGYVHWTPSQIRERMDALNDGRVAGQETAGDIGRLNSFMSRAFAASLVLLLHSAPSWVAGDWLVEPDGSTTEWYFTKSRYIAAIDASFDYKSERKDNLQEVQNTRRLRIAF